MDNLLPVAKKGQIVKSKYGTEKTIYAFSHGSQNIPRCSLLAFPIMEICSVLWGGTRDKEKL